MRILKEFSNIKNLSYLSIFITFYMLNNLTVLGLENKSHSIQKNQKDYQFEEIDFKNYIPFSEYDTTENQLKTFFGYSSFEPEKTFYPDLSIISNSDFIRELYKSKLNDMTITKYNYKIKNESTFKD
tara:strand:- start:390 stop:770 length:381 start_codon:yes stop_codon:yes gene_type:complete